MTRRSRIRREVVVALAILASAMFVVEPLRRVAGAQGPATVGSATVNSATVGPSTANSNVATSPGVSSSTATKAGVSDDAGTLTPYTNSLRWTHTPAGTPTLVTLACAARNTGIKLLAEYGGATMTPVITNQQSGGSGTYVGLFYLINPPPNPQPVHVWLGAAGAATDVECSATTWTGVTGIDSSIANTNQDMHGSATSLALNPKTTVPANEVFFGAIFRTVWACSGCGPSTLYVSTPASMVDDNLNVGSGFNHGCQALPNSPDYECIGSAQLPSGGTSMGFSWTYGAFVVAA